VIMALARTKAPRNKKMTGSAKTMSPGVSDGEGEYGGERVLIPWQRQEVHVQERDGPEDEPQGLTYPLEPLLGRGEHLTLLCERLVGATWSYVLAQEPLLL
jgi:hypothetical protein